MHSLVNRCITAVTTITSPTEGISGRPKVKKLPQTCIISALFCERICDYQVNNGLANRIERVLKDHRKCTSAWICDLFQINMTLEISTCE